MPRGNSGEQAVQRRRRHQRCRRGAALVELAVCLPVMVLITFGTIEAANAIFLRQALTEAANEGARTVTAGGGTESDARKRIKQILEAQDIEKAEIAFSPSVNNSTPAGTPVRVTVSAPSSANSVGVEWYFQGATLKGSVVMVRQQ
jgi:Flp pilus assembly protein TadG